MALPFKRVTWRSLSCSNSAASDTFSTPLTALSTTFIRCNCFWLNVTLLFHMGGDKVAGQLGVTESLANYMAGIRPCQAIRLGDQVR